MLAKDSNLRPSLIHPDGLTRPERFDVYDDITIFAMADGNSNDCPGHFIYKSDVINYVPDYVMTNVDGLEHYLYAFILSIKYGKKLVFSKRMTFVKNWHIEDQRYTVVPTPMQIRMMREMTRFEYRDKNLASMVIQQSPPIQQPSQFDQYPAIVKKVYGLMKRVANKLFAH